MIGFIEAFDAYVDARKQLRNSEEGSPEEKAALERASFLWMRLVEARQRVEREGA